ncbi:uncharacterized membrane protein HdeD (DUF308 family) [Flammeovirga kamogawensis]|nr:uncharacterized membrane protein HdeD (DUF308 family) [Flammeovirga kamogawensis]
MALLNSCLIIFRGINQSYYGYVSFKDNNKDKATWNIFIGILTIILGGMLLFDTAYGMDILLLYIGFYAIYKGLEQVILALSNNQKLRFLLIFGGLFNIIFGVIAILFPPIGVLTATTAISLTLFFIGTAEIITSFRNLKG